MLKKALLLALIEAVSKATVQLYAPSGIFQAVQNYVDKLRSAVALDCLGVVREQCPHSAWNDSCIRFRCLCQSELLQTWYTGRQ